MWLTSLLKSDSQRSHPARMRNRPRRLTLEALEDRCLLSFAIADLGTFTPTDLNNAGVVLGQSSDRATTVLWTSAGGAQNVGLLGPAYATGSGINDAGVVVGSAYLAGVTQGVLIHPRDTDQDGAPDLWFEDANQDGINDLMTDFGTLGIPLAGGTAINDSGQILYGLGLWDNVRGLQTVYDSEGAGYSSNALNNAGQAGGNRIGPYGYTRAYLYSGGQAIALGALPGEYDSKEYDLNDAAQVVGVSGPRYSGGNFALFQPREGFVWADGHMTGLGFLPGATVSEGNGINSFGQVVGRSYSGGGVYVESGQRAFVWDKGTMTDLNSLIDPAQGWSLTAAIDINDQGQILGTGWVNGETHAFLLTPPAPPAGIRVRPTPGLTTTEAGGTVQFAVKLNTQLAADVTVALASSDPTEGAVSVTSLTFTPDNWNIYQTVTVTGVDDPVYDGNIAYKILTGPAVSADPAYNGMDAVDLSLTNLDDDPPTLLRISSGMTVTEGNSGTVAAVFTVTRTGPTDKTTTVDYSIATNIVGAPNPLATAGSDFTAVSGTLTFAPGETSQTITVWVNGDTLIEPDEDFGVVITNPNNATIIGGLGLATILNDDTQPALTIGDVTMLEGNSGTTWFVFTVSLSAPSSQTVSVNYATADGTATSSGKSGDYKAASGTLTFAPGETTKTIRIAVYGNKTKEGNETFFVNLSGAAGAVIGDGQGLGTIVNDD